MRRRAKVVSVLVHAASALLQVFCVVTVDSKQTRPGASRASPIKTSVAVKAPFRGSVSISSVTVKYRLSTSSRDLERRMLSSICNNKRKINRDGKRRARNEVIPPVIQEDKFKKLEEDLLPGIINDITLAMIATKLPFGTIQNLPLVSPAWRQATQDRLIYDARALAHSGDTFAVISDTYSDTWVWKPTAISLYSLRDKSLYQLPPIPQVESGFPYDSECIALDGKVYVLGGSKEDQRLASKDVYVLDLAGRRQWKQCARMLQARANFKCGANDGKIYAFGGKAGKRWVLGSEVYDPSVDAWSSLTPMRSGPSVYDHNVSLQTTTFLRQYNWRLNNTVGMVGELLIVLGRDYKVRGYCPVTGTWRLLFQLDVEQDERHFVAQGKLHSMSRHKIQVYDVEENEWTERHSRLFDAIPNPNHLEPISVVAVDNEILALILRRRPVETEAFSTCLLQSKGFGSEDKEISWKELPCSLSFAETICFMSMSVLKL